MQRRNALLSACIQMKRKDFIKNAQIFQSITPEMLKVAAQEEEQGLPITNDAIKVLKKSISAVASQIKGTNSNRK
jgi:hypothetical protein